MVVTAGHGGLTPRGSSTGARDADVLSLVVCQCDALGRNLEVNHGWCRAWAAVQSCRAGPGHGLRACEGLRLH